MTQRQERRRHPRRVEPLDDPVAADLDVEEMPELALERVQQLVERRERRRVAGPRADAQAGRRIDAVVQRDLEHLRQVEVAGQDVGFLAERAGLDAAARAARARVLDALALAQQLLDDHVGVEDRRLAPALADDRRRRASGTVGLFALSWMFDDGCSRCISSMTSSSR